MLSGTVTAYANAAAKKADPYVPSGFAEASLPGLLISCSATAREAVELLGRVVGSRGHDGAEIYMIADKDEAWYVEVYTRDAIRFVRSEGQTASLLRAEPQGDPP